MLRPLALLTLLTLGDLARAQEAAATAPSLPSVISLHTQALGGTIKLAEITNVRFRGTIEQDGAKYPFTAWKRRPTQFRIEVETTAGKFVEANDGKRLWRQAPFLNDGKVSDLDFLSARLLRLESSFESPLLALRERAARITYLGVIKTPPPLPPYWGIQIDNTDGSRAQLFLDSRNYLLARMLWKENPDSSNELEILYGDYRSIQDMPVAHRIETRLEGKLVNVTTLDMVIMNPGAVMSLFSPPRPEDSQ